MLDCKEFTRKPLLLHGSAAPEISPEVLPLPSQSDLYSAQSLSSVYGQRLKLAYDDYNYAVETDLPSLELALVLQAGGTQFAQLLDPLVKIKLAGGWVELEMALRRLERAYDKWKRELTATVEAARTAWYALARQAFPQLRVDAGMRMAEVINAVQASDSRLRRLKLADLGRELQKRAQQQLLISSTRVTRKTYRSLLDVFRPQSKGHSSPLRYPGGKTRAVDFFLSLIPHDTTDICSPFVGGGSVELSAAACGVRVHAYDVFQPVVNFWQQALIDPASLADEAAKYFPLEQEKFYALQRGYDLIPNVMEQAAAFYVLNRGSFGGGTLSSGMAVDNRFTLSAIERLRHFQASNLSVGHGDFGETISRHENDLLFLDPPYLIESHLYGRCGSTHKYFDHGALWDLLVEIRHKKWILCYNDAPLVRDLYAIFECFTPVWQYGSGRDKRSRELLILSDPLVEQFKVCRPLIAA